MAKQLIVHAGLPKTGTTYLQQCLAHNARWLRALGVSYPELGREFLDGHHNVARALSRAQDSAALIGQLLSADACERVVISSEEFSTLNHAQVTALREACGDVELRWLLYLRRRSQLLVSRWKQDVRTGLTETLPAFVGAECVGYGDVLRPEVPLTVAVESLGCESLRVVVYDQVVATGEDLFDHFLRVQLGVTATDGATRPGQRVNEAIPFAAAEALRMLNAAKAPTARFAKSSWAQRAQAQLLTSARGRDLVDRVERLLDRYGTPFDVSGVDELWRSRDFEIVSACGDCIEQLQPDGSLFPVGSPSNVETLPPGILQEQLPIGDIHAMVAAIDAAG